nr:isocitrate lyase/phosphoenolpyruvate mutase family protein [Piscinibacter sakaiensis]
MPPDLAERRQRFRRLHASGCFVLPNPWDAGSARWLAGAGFQALASTSSGLAWSQGRADNHVGRDAVLAHLRELVAATALPVNADFENGFGARPEDVADSVRLAIDTGVAGLSIEDTTGDPARPLFPLAEAVDRLRAARAAIDASGEAVLLVGRADGLFAGLPDLDDVLRRIAAYAEAGADCLYAPGLRTREEIVAVLAAAGGRPVNVLMGAASPWTLPALAALGVRRISVGGALARAAWGGFIRAVEALADGRFDGFADAAQGASLNARFGDAAAGAR